ncbi:MAG: Tim44 domain-containing protein [Rubellimicrobium sp.]|nr:Tim44 domain-containing protein [Rubellimicrobium sp.]
MNSPIIQLLVLAGIAVFLILKLRSVLGSREGFERPPEALPEARPPARARDFEVIEGTPDRDIIDNVPEGSPAARALAQMKRAEPAFSVSEFLVGARGAYEMILMAFERGELEQVRAFLAPEVHDALASVVADRAAKGLRVEATFGGISSLQLRDAEFDQNTREAEITVVFGGEFTSVVRDAEGKVIEGSANEIRRQRDVWTFARTMGANDPNWHLVATGD